MTQEKLNRANTLLALIDIKKQVIKVFEKNEISDKRQIEFAIEKMSCNNIDKVKDFIKSIILKEKEEYEEEWEELWQELTI